MADETNIEQENNILKRIVLSLMGNQSPSEESSTTDPPSSESKETDPPSSEDNPVLEALNKINSRLDALENPQTKQPTDNGNKDIADSEQAFNNVIEMFRSSLNDRSNGYTEEQIDNMSVDEINHKWDEIKQSI